MNSLQLDTGGRPVANDDFQTLQDRDALLGLPALLSGLAPCVVSGCRLSQTGSQYNVGAGMVWDGSQLLDFSGRSNVALPMMFAPGAVVVVDERAYQTGGTKTAIKGQRMDLIPVVAGAPNLVIDTWGALTFWHLVRAGAYDLGDIKQSANLNTANYDATGLGMPGSAAWGWAVCNGQNTTADLRGMFILSYNPDRGNDGHGNNLSMNAVGEGGGEETHPLSLLEMPSHAHTATVDGPGNDPSANYAVFGALQNGKGGSQRQRTASTNSTGGVNGSAQAHNNMPPFYVLAMLQWVGY